MQQVLRVRIALVVENSGKENSGNLVFLLKKALFLWASSQHRIDNLISCKVSNISACLSWTRC